MELAYELAKSSGPDRYHLNSDPQHSLHSFGHNFTEKTKYHYLISFFCHFIGIKYLKTTSDPKFFLKILKN